uniref:Uncharacterized protein n=1 Tax=Arundo donax TaxID=35708 RepID=A0A0A9QYE7_ARUDO
MAYWLIGKENVQLLDKMVSLLRQSVCICYFMPSFVCLFFHFESMYLGRLMLQNGSTFCHSSNCKL